MSAVEPLDDAAYLRAMPKAELHLHLEGSIPAATVIDIARRNGASLPTDDADALYRVAIEREEHLAAMRRVPRWLLQALARKYQKPVDAPDDLYALGVYEAFLERFDDVCEVMRTADDFSRAAYDSLAAAASEANVRYREMFFHPMNHPGVRYATMLAGLVDGVRAAETDHGIVGRLIPAINRDHSAAAASDLVRAVIAHREPEVVGIASDYDEEHLPAFAEAYRLAADAGLPGTAHAGEYGSAQTVAEAIDVLGCRRIDHGYAIAADPALMARAADAGVHFAAIYSWSVAIHRPDALPLEPPTLAPERPVRSPIGDMLDAGLSVSIGSDDPVFEGYCDLAGEYVRTAGHLGLDRAAMTRLSLAAVDAAWMEPDERAATRRAFEAEIARLDGGADVGG